MFKRNLIRGKRAGAFVCLSVSILFSLILTTPSAAQDYPNRPITIVVGFAAGGAHGLIAQLFADNAKKYLPKSQPITVTFKAGAATAIAADYVLTQPRDGYTLYSYPIDIVVKMAKDGSQLKFTKDDFISIGAMAWAPCILPVRKESPFKTLEDFIDYGKKNPRKLSYGHSGAGGLIHMIGELIQDRFGIKVKEVPFSGGATAITAVLGGHVDTYLGSSTGPVEANVRDGLLRVLAVFSRERWYGFPEVPTCMEKGYDIDVTTWVSLAAPKGTPPEVVKILQEAHKKVAEEPQVKEAITRIGYKPVNWGPEETKKRADRDYDMAREIFTKAGLAQ